MRTPRNPKEKKIEVLYCYCAALFLFSERKQNKERREEER
mgnify:CR=1 FL=1